MGGQRSVIVTFPKTAGLDFMFTNTSFLMQDYFGENFERNVCFDESASVIVRSVDTCQCVYPPNAFSSKKDLENPATTWIWYMVSLSHIATNHMQSSIYIHNQKHPMLLLCSHVNLQSRHVKFWWTCLLMPSQHSVISVFFKCIYIK